MNPKIKIQWLGPVLVFFCWACGSSSGGGGSTVTLSTIDDLPQATSPVEASSGSGLALLQALATTGLPLGATTGDNFNASSSLAACEMFNMTKTSINAAAQADLILCYIQDTFAAASESSEFTDTNGDPIDIYDGEFHVFDLDFTGSNLCGENSDEPCDGSEEGGPDKVKFKIVRDANNAITSFQMFACSANSQDEYVSQTIDNRTFTMTSKESSSDSGGTFASEVTVGGTLSSSSAGKFSGTKSINMKHTFTASNFDFWGVFDYDQGATTGTLTGTMNGSNSFEGDDFTWNNRIASSVQLIDANTGSGDYDIGLLAMGDGCTRGCVQGTSGALTIDDNCTEDQANDMNSWRDSFTECWEADTALVPPLSDSSSSDFFEDVESATLPTDTEPTIAFTGDEAWDCSGTAETTISFADLGVTFASCSNLQLGYQWIDCWQTVNQ